MLKQYRVDLHIHTCLSPCADLTMSPKRVVEKAVEMNLDMIAICDHNSAENVQAAVTAAADKPVTVLPGMEITSAEEAHIIALFDKVETVLKLQETIYQHLPPGENEDNIFGEQIVANELDEVETFNKRLLMVATSLTIKELTDKIHSLGGLVIAAHIDREAFGIIGQLGFIPEDLALDALEISANIKPALAKERFPGIESFPLITSSDAHYLEAIGKSPTVFLLETPGFAEIHKALEKSEGRDVLMEV